MASPFVAEIRMFGGNFAPRGNAFCQGQILGIAQNTALFSLLGTTYGGNGTSNFGLPDLRGRAPMHQGNGPGLTPRFLGEIGGSENVTLASNQIPPHNHAANAVSTAGNQSNPANSLWASSPASGRNSPPVFSNSQNASMNAGSLSNVGGNGSHNNLQPYLAISFIIALQGVFPARN